MSLQQHHIPEMDANLGGYSQRVATTSAECQAWFDRGCVWAWGLHREEALACFVRAAEKDPSCAMAHWGVAFANGPEYNWNESGGFYGAAAQPEGFPSFKVAADAIAKATAALNAESPPREHALIQALSTLFEWPVTPEAPERKSAYADAMEGVATDPRFAADADIQSLAADAVMSLAPWKLYEADKTPKPVALRAKAHLVRGLEAAPAHMYLCHLRIHLDEMGPVADFDWVSAEALRATDAIDCGHLLHMPTHLDIQVGEYERAMVWNQKAVAADLRQLARAPGRFSIYTGYLVHNLEFTVWAAMYAGCQGAALDACDQIDTFLDEARLRTHPMLASFFEAYTATRMMALVRFGRWETILALPFKDDRDLYTAHTLFLHFARGIALGAMGDVAGARDHQIAFSTIRAALAPDTRRKHNVNLCEHTAPIAADVLEGELCYREGQFDACFAALEAGVAKYDALPYDEPAGYLMSPRQTLGALLAERGHHARAVGVYERDLKIFPKNVWSLAGLATCLRHVGGDGARLVVVQAELADARAKADVKVGASCACALENWKRGASEAFGEP